MAKKAAAHKRLVGEQARRTSKADQVSIRTSRNPSSPDWPGRGNRQAGGCARSSASPRFSRHGGHQLVGLRVAGGDRTAARLVRRQDRLVRRARMDADPPRAGSRDRARGRRAARSGENGRIRTQFCATSRQPRRPPTSRGFYALDVEFHKIIAEALALKHAREIPTGGAAHLRARASHRAGAARPPARWPT